MTAQNRVSLSGSKRVPLPGARITGDPDPNERIAVTLRLRSRSPQGLAPLSALYSQPHALRQHLTHEQYDAQYGANPADITAVESFAAANHLEVLEISSPRRTIRLAGTIANMQRAFGTTLKIYTHPHGSYRGREGEITLPAHLAGIVEGVFGLDNRPVAKPHFRPRDASSQDPAFTPPQLAALYNFPSNVNGAGQCIGILELGGGFQTDDLTNYFNGLGLTPPTVISVSVDGGTNSPSTPDSADGEVLLDIEVAGAIAPGAQIVVYFAPNQGSGFLDALTAAVHDNVHNPSVISISWGGPEDGWTDQDRQSFDQALQAAAALGVTVCVAAGDDGASDESNPAPNDQPGHVDFPASDPFALACGGTKLTANGSAIGSEVVWNELANGEGATGGGISDKFGTPSYQQGLTLPASINPNAGPGRGAPDVAGVADPTTGYHVLVDGQASVIGGTSAVAPLWAGLVACLNQSLGRRVGFLNPLLYSQLGPNGALNDITQGDNGGYTAGAGWDACTGWGSPNGNKILQALVSSGGQAVVTAPTPTAAPAEQLLTPTEK